MAHRDFLIIAP